jgi:FMN reductase
MTRNVTTGTTADTTVGTARTAADTTVGTMGTAGTARSLVVVTAGLSRPSSTRLLADRLAAATAERVAADVRMVELRELATEIAQNMVTGFPGPRLREAVDAVASADGLIAVTPVFTGSYSGLFKSFFDVVDKDALAGVPVLIAATGGTARHSLVLEHAMRPLFAYLRAVVVPTAVYAATEDWGADGAAGAVARGTGDGATGAATGAAGGDGALNARIDRAGRELAALVDARPVGPAAEEQVVPFAEQLAALAVTDG